MAVKWEYFDKYEAITDKYLPASGEGETKATQTVTAVTKLIYKWDNDGDVFDNQYALEGWCNDLSSYANWLWWNTQAGPILEDIEYCINGADYEDLLKDLADELLQEEHLKEANEQEKVGSIYKCDGPFKFVEHDEWDEEDW